MTRRPEEPLKMLAPGHHVVIPDVVRRELKIAGPSQIHLPPILQQQWSESSAPYEGCNPLVTRANASPGPCRPAGYPEAHFLIPRKGAVQPWYFPGPAGAQPRS